MNQAVAGAEEVHEGAEIDDLHDLAVVDHADFRLGDDAIDPVDRALCGFAIDRSDLDQAVVSMSILAPVTSQISRMTLPPVPITVADLVLRDRHRGDTRGVLGQPRATVDGLGHLAQDVHPAVPGLVQGDLHDLLGDRGDLDVHLQRGDALSGPATLKSMSPR